MEKGGITDAQLVKLFLVKAAEHCFPGVQAAAKRGEGVFSLGFVPKEGAANEVVNGVHTEAFRVAMQEIFGKAAVTLQKSEGLKEYALSISGNEVLLAGQIRQSELHKKLDMGVSRSAG